MERLLAEDLVLLCWDDEKGKPHAKCSTGFSTGIAGALLIDAMGVGALEVLDDRVHPTGTAPSDPLLAAVVADTERARKPKKVKDLVGHLDNRKRTNAVLDRMVESGALRRQEHRVLGLFPVTRRPTADTRTAKAVRGQVRDLLLGRRRPGDGDSHAVLLAKLARSTGALNVLVERKQRKEAQRRADGFDVGSDVPEAVAKAIQQAQAAVMAAIAAGGAAAGAGS
ncbi:MAG TPA: GPP34 family phosphoprotein [Egicoccus sp.]|nr:GPP34 family phosphoprotein [Egicoccus sp.]HSK23006.1 GPP34 family phosphoprotein [Egicoccus sp.]